MDGLRHFSLRYDTFSRVLIGLLGGGPRLSGIDIGPDQVFVRMGWLFRARLHRRAVRQATEVHRTTLNRGVHGWLGRWLVNGSTRGLVELSIDPPGRGYVCFVPVKLRALIVSVEEPSALVAAVGVANA